MLRELDASRPERNPDLVRAELGAFDASHKDEVRLWLRLLALTNMIEAEIRQRLRRKFNVTLPRFDLLAQLARAPAGLTLSELSKRMMVSNGNITGLVETLVSSGHVGRRTDDEDRRARVVRLTPLGRRAFAKMAAEHHSWVSELLGKVSAGDRTALSRLLETTKASVQAEVTRNAS